MSGKTALVLGATGQVGRHVLTELLASPQYSRVAEYGRKTTPLENLPAGKEKLEQKTIDFEKLGESGLKDGKWDVVFITLGTTRKNAGSAENFEKIDREYVLNAAREARSLDSSHEQRVVYVSSVGANPTSSFLYNRSKGLTEQGLASLGYSDTIIFRPAMLVDTKRAEHRPLETIASRVTGLLSSFTDKLQIPVPVLGKSVVRAGLLGSQGLASLVKTTKEGESGKEFTVLDNSAALALSQANV